MPERFESQFVPIAPNESGMQNERETNQGLVNDHERRELIRKEGVRDGTVLAYKTGLWRAFGLGENPQQDYPLGEFMKAIKGNILRNSERRGNLFQDIITWDDYRDIDKQIEQFVQRAIESSSAPLRILEIGGGTTYPTMGGAQFYGSPWLARRLKLQYGDRVDLTVTDIRDSSVYKEAEFFQKTRDGHLRRLGTVREIDADVLKLLPPNVAGWVNDVSGHSIFRSIDNPVASDLMNRMAKSHEAKRQQVNLDSNSLDWVENVARSKEDPNLLEGVLYVRPSIDAELERKVSGLQLMGNVDVNDLGQHFAKESFDFIYGRQLSPEDVFVKGLSTRLEPFLVPGGTMIWHVDDGSDEHHIEKPRG